MKKILRLLAFSMLYALPAWSQTYTTGGITAVDTSATCSTTNGFVAINVLQNASSVAFTVSGTFGATLQFVGTVDGTSWVAVNAFPPNSTTAATSTTAAGTWKADVASFSQFCVRASAYSSGTATVGMRNGQGVSTSTLAGSVGSTPLGISATPSAGQIFVSPNCPAASNASCFNIKDDGVVDVDATYSSGSNQITTSSAVPAFTSNDNGKQGFATGNCSSINEWQCTLDCPQGAVTVVSAHVSNLGGGNCVHNSSATAHANRFQWCTPDGAQLAAAFAAMFPSGGNSVAPQQLDLPGGTMCADVNPFVVPTIASRRWPIYVHGHNQNIILLPNMNCNPGASNGCVLSDPFASDALGQLGEGDMFDDLNFDGGGTDNPGTGATYQNPAYGILCAQYCTLKHVSFSGWVWNRASANITYGLYLRGGAAVNSVFTAAGNYGALCQDFNLVPANFFGGDLGASQYNSLVVSPSATTAGCVLVGEYTNQPGCASAGNKLCYGIYNNGGNLHIFGGDVSLWQDSGNSWINNARMDGFSAVYDINLAGGSVAVGTSQFATHMNMTGGTLKIAGGNGIGTSYAWPSSPGINYTAGTVQPYKSVTGACSGTATSSQTTMGLYGTGPNVTATTCTQTTLGTGVPMETSGTLGSLFVTATHAGVSASSGVVTVMLNHAGGGLSATTLTCTIGTGTSCNDNTHTASYVAGDLVSIQYTTQVTEVLAGVQAFVMTQY